MRDIWIRKAYLRIATGLLALALLAAFAVPAVLTSTWRPGVERSAYERGASSGRLARHFFDLATTAVPGKEVRVSRQGNKVILEPIEKNVDVDALFAELDRLRELAGGEFLPEGIPPDIPVKPEDIGWDDVPGDNLEPPKGKK